MSKLSITLVYILFTFCASLVLAQISPASADHQANLRKASKQAESMIKDSLLEHFEKQKIQFLDNPTSGLSANQAKHKLANDLAVKIANVNQDEFMKASQNLAKISSKSEVQMTKILKDTDSKIQGKIPSLVKQYFKENVELVRSPKARKNTDLVKRFALPALPIRIVGGILMVPLTIISGILFLISALIANIGLLFIAMTTYILPSRVRRFALKFVFEQLLTKSGLPGALDFMLHHGLFILPEIFESLFAIDPKILAENEPLLNAWVQSLAEAFGEQDLSQQIQTQKKLNIKDKKIVGLLQALQKKINQDKSSRDFLTQSLGSLADVIYSDDLNASKKGSTSVVIEEIGSEMHGPQNHEASTSHAIPHPPPEIPHIAVKF